MIVIQSQDPSALTNAQVSFLSFVFSAFFVDFYIFFGVGIKVDVKKVASFPLFFFLVSLVLLFESLLIKWSDVGFVFIRGSFDGRKLPLL